MNDAGNMVFYNKPAIKLKRQFTDAQKDRRKERNAQWFQENKEKRMAANAAWRAKNPAKWNSYSKKWKLKPSA